ncbi:MAG: type II toxin-antitoxin system VapB family antitoxin [Methylococcales bacterium]|nr:type II toxin-antitoxin system VapB family antitoxin [Methylococcales bacterium]
MQQTITISDTLFKNASQCAGLDDVNEVINMALLEFINNHQTVTKRRQPPASIAGKAKINGDLIEPCFASEDFECLK